MYKITLEDIDKMTIPELKEYIWLVDSTTKFKPSYRKIEYVGVAKAHYDRLHKDDQVGWIKFCRESFATDEDWESVCELAGVSPSDAVYVQLFIKNIVVYTEGDNK